MLRTLFINVTVPSAESRLMLEMDVLGIPEEGLKETSYDDEKEEEEYG